MAVTQEALMAALKANLARLEAEVGDLRAQIARFYSELGITA